MNVQLKQLWELIKKQIPQEARHYCFCIKYYRNTCFTGCAVIYDEYDQ